MKSLVLLLSLLLCQAAASNDAHQRALHPHSKSSKSKRPKSGKRPNYYRPKPNYYWPKYDDDGGLVCLDLKNRGQHTLYVSEKVRAITQFRNVDKDRCKDESRFSWGHRQYASYCKEMNNKMVTIRAPRGMGTWMRDVMKADRGACKYRDALIVIKED